MIQSNNKTPIVNPVTEVSEQDLTGQALDKANHNIQQASAELTQGLNSKVPESRLVSHILQKNSNQALVTPENGIAASENVMSTSAAIAASEVFGVSHLVVLKIIVAGNQLTHY